MANYLAAIWKCRHFWVSLVKMDLRSRYRGSVLGMGWSLLHPLAMTAILCLVFCRFFGFDNPGEYGLFLMAGLATWNYILTATLQGCQCFFRGESYIRQYPAPLAIYPLRTTLGGIIHFLVALAVVLVLMVLLNANAGRPPMNLPSLACLLPSILLLFLFGWSLSLLAGLANVYFQDTQHLAEVSFQILFYASGVMYPPQLLRDQGLGWLVDYNPFVAFLDLVRLPVLDGQVPSVEIFGMATATVVVMLGGAALLLGRLQRRLIFRL